jgi:predicted esterase
MSERIIPATIHGRYLTIPPEASGPAPLLVGFHGYGEDAETQLERLCAIPDSDRWLKVSIQALSRFYERRTNRVVASWMTRQDRESAIADNIAYVTACIDAVDAESQTLPNIVFAGFSQGAGMAFRAGVNAAHRVASVIAVGGDVPPELTPMDLRKLSAALIARGSSDQWYTEEQFAKDEQRLRECSVSVHALRLNAGHEWSSDLVAAASAFLHERYSR